MALLGLATAFLVAVVADIRGDERTRLLARSGWWALVLVEGMGLSLAGIANAIGNTVGMLI